jgi:hypothetical protein
VDVSLSADNPSRNRVGSLASLVADGVLDAELAALVSLLVEARVPVVVAGSVPDTDRAAVLEAVLAARPSEVRRVPLEGAAEDFGWLPEAEALGWRSDGPGSPAEPDAAGADPETTLIEAGELTRPNGGSAWAGVVRIAVRAVSLGYGLAATADGDSLETVLTTLRGTPFRLTEDELSRLGVVLVLARPEGEPLRVVAGHYLRPVARDMHGHVQKLGPAVLATWDAAAARFEHFGWGVTPELALRTGRRAGDFEIEMDRRRAAYAAGTEPTPEERGDAPIAPPNAPHHGHDHAGHDHAGHDHAGHDHARTTG